MPTTSVRTIAILLFDGVNAIDVAGPLEAFTSARNATATPLYCGHTIGHNTTQVSTESGLRLCVDAEAEGSAGGDLLIIPGGHGVRDPQTLSRLAGWLRTHHMRYRRVASICTGAYALAEAGLLDGRRITTHWAHAADLAQRYPLVSVDPDALFLRDGQFLSSGGVTAGIDLALDVIEGDHGANTAMAVARELVVYLRRTGSQAQFSAPLRLQTPSSGALADVCLWAANNLSIGPTVEMLAARANLSSRQFTRRFTQAFGLPPARYLRGLRLDAARGALGQPHGSLERIALGSGFRSVDGFRRAFERRFGLCPADYRRRFQHWEEGGR